MLLPLPMHRLAIFLCFSVGLAPSAAAQEVRFEVGDTLLVSGAPVTLPLKVFNFESVVSFQFSIGWDSSMVLSEAQFDPVLASGLAYNTFARHINISWLGPSSGITLQDGTELLTLSFETLGCPGDTAQVGLTKEYIPWEVGQVDDGGGLSLNAPDTASNFTTWRPPDLLLLEDTLICAGSTLTLLAECLDCTTIQWGDNPNSAAIDIDSAGLYPVTATSANDCIFTDTVAVELDTFQLRTLKNASRCPSDSIVLTLPDTLLAYEWSSGAATSSITVNEGGLYTVTVTNENGCIALDSALIEDTPLPMGILFAEPPIVCPGDSSRLVLDTSAVERIIWLDTEGRVAAEDSITLWVQPDSTRAYLAISTNACGSDTAAVTLELVDFEASAGQDTCIASGASVELQASGGNRYRWLESEYPVSSPDIPNPVVQPADSAWFVVEIFGPAGCVLLDSVLVEVATNPFESIMPINLITPNGDDKNDILFFKNLSKFPDNQLIIWNRWGQVVYEKKAYQQDDERWDGSSRAGPLPDGEYYYLLKVNEERIQQTLSIIRE